MEPIDVKFYVFLFCVTNVYTILKPRLASPVQVYIFIASTNLQVSDYINSYTPFSLIYR